MSPIIKSTNFPKDFEEARSKLIECIKSSIGPNRRHHDKECEEFYIGTSTICEQCGPRLDLDPDEPDTWNTKLIREQWYKHREDGYQVMHVLIVVKKKNLPQSYSSRGQYTTDLKEDLIMHFKKDKRLKTTPTAPGSPEESVAAYVLYLAMRIWPKLVVPLNEYSSSLVNLPHNYKKSVSKLVDYIKSIIAANEKHYYTKCEEFYIGKGTIHTPSGPSIFGSSRQHFDPDDKLIEKQWYEHSEDGYEAMVVLTVMTYETLPLSQDSLEQYTLELNKDLIMHFQDEKDKRLKTMPRAPESPLASGAAYALYLAMKFGPNLVVSLCNLSYPLIKLPKDYNKSLSKLIEHINSIIEANEKYHYRKCEEFYIGKSTAHFDPDKPDFDTDNPNTWNTELIHHCWRDRRKDGYQAMAVLAVVTKETLPPLWSQSPDVRKEQYTVALKQGLITHFMFVEDDERLANETTEPGKFAGSDAKAHVLYLAMKLKQ